MLVKLIKQSKSENADDTKQITDGTKQNKRRQVKYQCAKTGFERCAMQITIAIKVPYHMNNEEKKVKTLSTRSETRTARSRTR
ncbi:hypothetical protein T02_13398 [Trichinella nativa]|uniref:Uncharacterized protein n=1 Tax=Trichinella nativa TaxID=6335 RepID=A0A0V1KMW9_9BILA|nr:hypothetical protein T02_13398 [Trichinella nativa]